MRIPIGYRCLARARAVTAARALRVSGPRAWLVGCVGWLWLFVAAGLANALIPTGDGGRTYASGYRAPVAGIPIVLAAFDPNLAPYSAGHRGADLADAQGATVFAAGSGIVRFAGSVAGRGVLVIAHGDGIETEYEPVSSSVRAGARVAAGQPIGRVNGQHAHCAPASCLHWGARAGFSYLDPMKLLAPLGRVRLIPSGS